ncbi:MAG TPA: hypothetical protein VNT58_09465, partial [Gaiellaceae bacterium]|nr:hypothetical protein [Gaiellaceae bacterium]
MRSVRSLTAALAFAASVVLLLTATTASAGTGTWGELIAGTTGVESRSGSSSAPSGRGFWFYEIDPGSRTINWNAYDSFLKDKYADANWGDDHFEPVTGKPNLAGLAMINRTRREAWGEASQKLGRGACNDSSAATACVLWNWEPPRFCDSGGTLKSPTPSIIDRRAPACYFDGSAAQFKGWQEMHNLYHSPSNRPDATAGNLIAWNVTIWRGPRYMYPRNSTNPALAAAGQEEPIFERRIGLCLDRPGEHNTDPEINDDQTTLQNWWLGKTPNCNRGGLPLDDSGSPGWVSRGPIGSMTTPKLKGPIPHYSTCRKNLQQVSDENKRAGIEDAYGPIGMNAYKQASGKNGPGMEEAWERDGFACFWEISDEEALYLEWGTAFGGGSGGNGRFHFTFNGQKGRWYAIHITAVDRSEQLMLGDESKLNALGNIQRKNYFEVFVPTAEPNKPRRRTGGGCPPNCPVPPPPAPVASPQSEPQVAIFSDRVVPAQVRSQSTVHALVPRLTVEQALYPKNVTLWHYTPQLQHNGGRSAAGASYSPDDYVEHDSELGIREPFSAGPAGEGLYVAKLMQPIHTNGARSTACWRANSVDVRDAEAGIYVECCVADASAGAADGRPARRRGSASACRRGGRAAASRAGSPRPAGCCRGSPSGRTPSRT